MENRKPFHTKHQGFYMFLRGVWVPRPEPPLGKAILRFFLWLVSLKTIETRKGRKLKDYISCFFHSAALRSLPVALHKPAKGKTGIKKKNASVGPGPGLSIRWKKRQALNALKPDLISVVCWKSVL